MRKLWRMSLVLILAMGLGIAASAAQYATAADLFTAWEQSGYPDYVAGVYSADGGPALVIQLVAGYEDQADALQSMVDETLTLEFGAVYSHNELTRISHEIVEQYMGGDSPVVGCGVGWRSVDGFGESGTESRVIVSVLTEHAQAYADQFYAAYGDAVVVESSEGISVDATTAVQEELAHDVGVESGWNVWYVLLTLLIAALAIGTLYIRYRPRRAAQTVDGERIPLGRVSRTEAETAVRESDPVTPRLDFDYLKRRL